MPEAAPYQWGFQGMHHYQVLFKEFLASPFFERTI